MTSEFVKVEKYEHWYDESGCPCHEVEVEQKEVVEYYWPDGSLCTELEGQNGKVRKPRKTDIKTFGLNPEITQPKPKIVPVDLRLARKVILRPSVTNVLGIRSKAYLEGYKLRCLLEVMALNPHDGREPWMDYLNRMALHSDDKRREAAREGFLIHDLLNQCHLALGNGESLDQFKRDIHWPYVALWFDWLAQYKVEIIDVEKSFCSKLGYGGTVDLVIRIDGQAYVIDFKSTDSKGKSMSTQKDHRYQVAAYHYAMGIQGSLGMVVHIDRNETTPGRIRTVPLDLEVLDESFETFMSFFDSWIRDNKYNPLAIGGQTNDTTRF